MKTYKEGWYWAIDEDGYAWPAHMFDNGRWCVVWGHYIATESGDGFAVNDPVEKWVKVFGFKFEPMVLPKGAKQ
jgi:hypothetical protein